MRMIDTGRLCSGVLAIALACAATGALAQTPPNSANPRNRQPAASSDQPARRPAPAAVRVVPDPWPRLDPGAVFCRTEADLRQHLAAVAARLDGSPGRVTEPTGCRTIRTRTPIAVLSREGPAHTQVKLSDPSAETGWTDAFLPPKRIGP